MNDGAAFKTTGHDAPLARPVVESIWRRRTHRVSRGVAILKVGSMTYTSNQKPLPLNELEGAVLIAGLTMPDRPFQDPTSGEFIMAKPNLTMDGRTAGSPDRGHLFL